MKRTLRIVDSFANPAEKIKGKFVVGSTPLVPVEVPFTIVNGIDDGPILAVGAGVHATEYPGIEATMRLSRMIDPKALSGAVVLVHTINTLGFQAKLPYLCPVDGLNVNRVFPGNPDGSMSYRLAYALFSQIISKANYYVDLHCGDIPEEHIDIVYYTQTGGKTDQVSERMARCFSTSYIHKYSTPGSSTTEASKIGIPAIISEAGELGRLDESAVNFHVEGVLNLMRTFDLLKEPPKPTSPKMLGERFIIRSNKGGFLHRKAKSGDMVAKDQALAEIVDVYGDSIETVRAPTSGVILMGFPSPAVNSGDYLYCICPLEG